MPNQRQQQGHNDNPKKTQEAIGIATQWGFGLLAHQGLRHESASKEMLQIATSVRRLIIVGQTISLLSEERITPDQERLRRIVGHLNHVLGCGVTIYQNPTNVLMSIFARRMLETSSYSWERYDIEYSASKYEQLQKSVGKDYCAFESRTDKHIPWGGAILNAADNQIAEASLSVLRDILLFVLDVYITPLKEIAPEAHKILETHQTGVQV
jgi:hypothetical protein